MSLTILKALPEAGPAWRGGSLIGPVDHELLAATLSAPGYQRAAQPVAPITLDEILGENGLNEVDLLKLDCEGCESSVLGCADPDLLRRIPFHNQRVSRAAPFLHSRSREAVANAQGVPGGKPGTRLLCSRAPRRRSRWIFAA